MVQAMKAEAYFINDMKVTELLPMKRHSERVPDKNTRTFVDEPLFYKILSELHHSALINKIIVNTDSEVIAKMAKEKSDKIIIHIRPKELRGDYVSMNLIIKYDLEHSDADVYLQTHSTNPMLKQETIDSAIKKYFEAVKHGCDSLFSVTRYQNRLYDSKGNPVNHDPHKLLRTQDLPVLFEENSCLYIFSRDSFSNNQDRRIGSRPLMYEIDKIEAVDINTNEDFLVAEALYKTYVKKGT